MNLKDSTISNNELYDQNHPVRQNLYFMDTIEEIQNQRTLVMNPYSHYDITKPEFKIELQLTIDAVKKLKLV